MAFGVIDTDADNTGVLLLKGRLQLVKADDFGGTHEGKIMRIEKDYDHLRADALETYVANAVVEGAREIE